MLGSVTPPASTGLCTHHSHLEGGLRGTTPPVVNKPESGSNVANFVWHEAWPQILCYWEAIERWNQFLLFLSLGWPCGQWNTVEVTQDDFWGWALRDLQLATCHMEHTLLEPSLPCDHQAQASRKKREGEREEKHPVSWHWGARHLIKMSSDAPKETPAHAIKN